MLCLLVPLALDWQSCPPPSTPSSLTASAEASLQSSTTKRNCRRSLTCSWSVVVGVGVGVAVCVCGVAVAVCVMVVMVFSQVLGDIELAQGLGKDQEKKKQVNYNITSLALSNTYDIIMTSP